MERLTSRSRDGPAMPDAKPMAPNITGTSTGALTAPATGQVTLDPYAPTTGAGVLNMTLDMSGSTQYGSTFALRDVRQDGYAAGKLSEISVAEAMVTANWR